MTFVQQLVLFGHVLRIDEENCLTTFKLDRGKEGKRDTEHKMERRRTYC
jgi:hypothetical protein